MWKLWCPERLHSSWRLIFGKFRFPENFDSSKNQNSKTISFYNWMICPYIFQILTNCRFDLFLHFQMLPKSDSNSKVDFLFCQIGHVLSYQLQLKWVSIVLSSNQSLGPWQQIRNPPEIYCIMILLDSVFPLPDSPVIKMHF